MRKEELEMIYRRRIARARKMQEAWERQAKQPLPAHLQAICLARLEHWRKRELETRRLLERLRAGALR